MPVLKMCKDGCGRSVIAWDTITNRCAKCTEKRRKERSKAKPPKPLKRSTKPIKKLGKKGVKWLSFRKKWLKNHPPNHQGYYTCYICLRQIPAEEITLDHVIPRSRRPDLVFDENNVRPACGQCNTDKGSKTW